MSSAEAAHMLVSRMLANPKRDGIAVGLKQFAIKHLNSQFIMRWIMTHDSDPALRSAAAAKVRDPRLLLAAARQEMDPRVRSALMKRLRPSDLATWYSEATPAVKAQIIGVGLSPTAAFRALKDETDERLAMQLLGEIRDPTMLALLQHHPLAQVRSEALRRAQWVRKTSRIDPNRLIQAILAHQELDQPMIRMLRSIASPKIWLRVAQEHQTPKVAQLATRNLEGYPTLLTQVAYNRDLVPQVRQLAVSLLGPVPQTEWLALHDPSWQIRLQATATLRSPSNAPTLAQQAQTERNPDVLDQVVLKTRSLADLQAIRTRTPAEYPQLTALVDFKLAQLKEEMRDTS